MPDETYYASSNLWLGRLPIVAVLSLAIIMPGLITAIRNTEFSTAPPHDSRLVTAASSSPEHAHVEPAPAKAPQEYKLAAQASGSG